MPVRKANSRCGVKRRHFLLGVFSIFSLAWMTARNASSTTNAHNTRTHSPGAPLKCSAALFPTDLVYRNLLCCLLPAGHCHPRYARCVTRGGPKQVLRTGLVGHNKLLSVSPPIGCPLSAQTHSAVLDSSIPGEVRYGDCLLTAVLLSLMSPSQSGALLQVPSPGPIST